MTHLDSVLQEMTKRGVSPEIRARVARLNLRLAAGEIPRGIHYKSFERQHMRLMYGCMSKGEFIRRYGRAAFARINPDHLRKRGRRVYVSHRWRDHADG